MAESGLLDRDQTTVLVVDVQEKLAAVMERREATVRAVAKLVQAAKRLAIPILLTEQYPRGLGPTVAEVKEALDDLYHPLSKISFGCCEDDSFKKALADLHPRRQLILCGMEAHVCVFQTAVQLKAAGYSVWVAADAICSRRDMDMEIALGQMRLQGVSVTTVESAIFQLLRRAGTPEFKDILSIVK